MGAPEGGDGGWGGGGLLYCGFRVLVNVCVCVSSVRVLGGGGTVVAFCLECW